MSASALATRVPPASDPASPDPIAAEVARLGDLELHELRVRWRKLFRKEAPAHLSRSLLSRVIAYKLQANAYGDLDRETVRFLEQIRRESERRGEGAKARIVVPPVPERRGLKPGTLLVREHEGTLHRVTVLDSGFAWNGAAYGSLSEVARAITGTRWNGPRFFGMRERASKQQVQGRPA